ncbi:MAG: hypothetical protein M0036_20715 [Desulfobacteraceae bacterium]|nr:hypothetical protein [Desulfobacteraceae bacterium]
MDVPDIHPVQKGGSPYQQATVRKEVSLRAYAVYSKIFGPQPTMVTGGCRGGFGASELVAFLYAATFPEKEWKDRVEEAFGGMSNL